MQFTMAFTAIVSMLPSGVLCAGPLFSSLLQVAEPDPGEEHGQHGDLLSGGLGRADKVWDETTQLSKETEVIVAIAWISILAGLPLLLRWLDGFSKPWTKVQLVIGGAMWITIFGAMYLFTNIVHFDSGHFKESRPLNLVECIYLMSQIITTVGYGDITPAYTRGQVFVGIYVLMALSVIAMLLGDLTTHVVSAVDSYRKHFTGKNQQSDELTDMKSAMNVAFKHRTAPTPHHLILTIACFVFFAATWTVFFHFYPGENKTWSEATYMSVITLSTVGFGAFTPQTSGGMVFASFWMIFGSAALVSVVGSFTKLTVDLAEYERFDEEAAAKHIKDFELEGDGDDAMSEAEFVLFALNHNGVMPDSEIQLMRQCWSSLVARNGGDGQSVDVSTLCESLQ